jgi:hypothetical protein
LKNKLSQIIFSFITGATLSHAGDPLPSVSTDSHQVLMDKSPVAQATKLTPAQLKDVLDLKLIGYDAYMISVQNDSRRSYSITTASIDAECECCESSQKILAKKANIVVQAVGGACGLYFMPVGFATNVYSMVMAKKGKIFQGKLQAMLLDKDVVHSYSSLSRLVLIKSGDEIKGQRLDLIDLQTMQVKSITIG